MAGWQGMAGWLGVAGWQGVAGWLLSVVVRACG